MSLLIYLTAFFFQLPLHPSNRLTIESISVMFGPSMLALRSSTEVLHDGLSSEGTKRSQDGMYWLLNNWDDSLSQDLLDEEYDCMTSPAAVQDGWLEGSEGDEEDGFAADGPQSEDEEGEFYAQSVASPRMPQYQTATLVKAAGLDSSSPTDNSVTETGTPYMTQDSDYRSTPRNRDEDEVWGHAISPTEDQVSHQNVPTEGSPPGIARGSTEPAFAPHEETGDSSTDMPTASIDERPVNMHHKSISPVQEADEHQIDGDRAERTVAETDGVPAKPTAAQMHQYDTDATPHDEVMSIPGALALPRSYTERDEDAAAASNRSDIHPAVPSATGHATVPSSDSANIDGNIESMHPHGGPLHSRKDGMDSERRPSSSESPCGEFRQFDLQLTVDFSSSAASGLARSQGSSGLPYHMLQHRPASSARSEAASEIGGSPRSEPLVWQCGLALIRCVRAATGSTYLPEELSNDPNAARLFGSLGELFAAEKRRVAEMHGQVRQYEQRVKEQEEEMSKLRQRGSEQDVKAGELQTRIESLQSRVGRYEHETSEYRAKQKELEDLVASLQRQVKQEEDRRQVLASNHEQRLASERAMHEEEIQRLKDELRASHSERESHQVQLEKIRTLLGVTGQ